MGAKILQFYEKCKSCPKLFASKGKKAIKGKKVTRHSSLLFFADMICRIMDHRIILEK